MRRKTRINHVMEAIKRKIREDFELTSRGSGLNAAKHHPGPDSPVLQPSLRAARGFIRGVFRAAMDGLFFQRRVDILARGLEALPQHLEAAEKWLRSKARRAESMPAEFDMELEEEAPAAVAAAQ